MNPNETSSDEQMDGVKQQLCTVTPFSKYLALSLFIALPFIGFWVGRQYPATTPAEVTDVSPAEEMGSDAETVEEPTSTEASESANAPLDNQVPAPAQPAGPTVLTVYITEMTIESVSVNNIAIYEGSAGVQRMIADGLCSASEPQKCALTGGAYYRNTDSTIRTYPLSKNVVVKTWTGADYPIGKLINKARTQAPYSITLSSTGVVTQIDELYRE